MRQHDIQIRVRYSETDAMGFLHHANFVSYFEIGRTELFRAQGGDYRAMEEGGLFLVVAKLDCRYRATARTDIGHLGFACSSCWRAGNRRQKKERAGLDRWSRLEFCSTKRLRELTAGEN